MVLQGWEQDVVCARRLEVALSLNSHLPLMVTHLLISVLQRLQGSRFLSFPESWLLVAITYHFLLFLGSVPARYTTRKKKPSKTTKKLPGAQRPRIYKTWHSETFISFIRSCALTFYLGFSRLHWILLDIDFFFILWQKYAIFLTVLNIFYRFSILHSLSCIASSDTDPDTPHRAQRVAVLSRIPSASSGITEISHICAYSECGIRTRLRKAMDPSAGTVSLKSQTSVLCSISDCLLIFFIFFLALGSLRLQPQYLGVQSCCLRSEFPPHWVSGPRCVNTVGFCGVAYAHILIVD